MAYTIAAPMTEQETTILLNTRISFRRIRTGQPGGDIYLLSNAIVLITSPGCAWRFYVVPKKPRERPQVSKRGVLVLAPLSKLAQYCCGQNIRDAADGESTRKLSNWEELCG